MGNAAIWIAAAAGAAATGLALAGPRAVRRLVRNARDDHARRPALWNRFYAIDWGDITTNNYGFAPAEGLHPQRFQHQLYRELLERLRARRAIEPGMTMLEISCGRGGGLNALLARAPEIDATGLDVAESAIAFCRSTYGEHRRLRFVCGSALDLPFADGSFDVVLNVEASNDYGDRRRFFAEAARVLKEDGVLLFADTVKTVRQDDVEGDLAAAGFAAEMVDITDHVAEACRLDSPRRRAAIDRHAPVLAKLLFRKQIENYAAVEGSKKYRSFRDGRRRYLMTAAVKA